MKSKGGRVSKQEMVNKIIKNVNGQIVWDGFAWVRRWAEYFEQVLNVEDVRELNINVFGDIMYIV